MAASGQGAVTARGVRDGDPGALVALAGVRGPAVLAFCNELCDPAAAVIATADAFARFRAAVYAAPRLDAIAPDALLLQRTRHAAAEHALPAPPATGVRQRMNQRRSGTCPRVASLLAARAGGQLSDGDRQRLGRHLSRCAGCRVIEARFVKAERAYRTTPPGALPRDVADAIVGALSSAAPVNGVAERLPETIDAPPAAPVPQVAPVPRVSPAPHAPPALPAPETLPAPPTPIAYAAPDAFGEPASDDDGADLTTMFGPISDEPEHHEPATVSFAAGAARRARGAMLRPGAVRRRERRPHPPRAPRRGGIGVRLMAPAAIILGGVVAVLAIAGVLTPRHHAPRRSAAALAPSTTPAAPRPLAMAKHRKHSPRHRRHVHRRVSSSATKTKSLTVAATRRRSTTTAQTSPAAKTPAVAPQRTVTAHVIDGARQQAPPKTGAPSGPAPSGYQPATTP